MAYLAYRRTESWAELVLWDADMGAQFCPSRKHRRDLKRAERRLAVKRRRRPSVPPPVDVLEEISFQLLAFGHVVVEILATNH